MNPRRNLSLALSLAAFTLGMVMLAYASVPLYRLFCQATGFGGAARVSQLTSHKVLDRTLTVRFDANVHPPLDWRFKPVQTQVQVKLGEEKRIEYLAVNTGPDVTGTATFNVTPVKAGVYFNKIQCFCFTKQHLRAGEEKRFPVVFFIDPALARDHELDDIHTITLSYTFFPVQKTQ